jgi:hypothetical protein
VGVSVGGIEVPVATTITVTTMGVGSAVAVTTMGVGSGVDVTTLVTTMVCSSGIAVDSVSTGTVQATRPSTRTTQVAMTGIFFRDIVHLLV